MLRSDLHTHLMPGVDDGSRSAVETVAMAKGLAALGVERVYLTPHQFKLGNELDVVDVKRRTDAVWRILARAEVSIEVRAGAEYYYGERLLDALAREEPLITFEWEGRESILVELPMHHPAVGVRRVGETLVRRGLCPILAHPERTPSLEPDRIRGWRDAGWRMQLNLLSLVRRHGSEAARVSHWMLRKGLYDGVGSDLHRPSDLAALRQAHETYRSLAGNEVMS